MEQEDKELLLKDLCARLPYHVKVKVWLEDVDTEEGVLDLEYNYADVLQDAFYYNKIKKIKPYLRPMSSMTAEEYEQYRKFSYYGAAGYRNNDYKEMVATPSFEKMDFLNAHHFDYRGLIEKGLAIEAPEDMYK